MKTKDTSHHSVPQTTAELAPAANVIASELVFGSELKPECVAPAIRAFLTEMPDVVCFSHHRWDFVYHRQQHLLSRFARHGRLFFVEEPVYAENTEKWLEITERADEVKVVVPHLPLGLTDEEAERQQKELLNSFFAESSIDRYLFWYYSPMALAISDQFRPLLTVYDCTEDLSAETLVPERLLGLEKELLQKADLVFTSGQSLYETKKNSHPRVYAFPSGIDKEHFEQARKPMPEQEDQAKIPHPRLGFFGVIDERMDTELLRQVAAARPEWHFVMVGPVVKADPQDLPKNVNIHYLGGKKYEELPAYLSGWDVALLPFARNEHTRYISPTKTPEYLAAGKPVVSTPIQDVVRPYGELGLVQIADGAEEFVKAVGKAFEQTHDMEWVTNTTKFLSGISWDHTWQSMVCLMHIALSEKK